MKNIRIIIGLLCIIFFSSFKEVKDYIADYCTTNLLKQNG